MPKRRSHQLHAGDGAESIPESKPVINTDIVYDSGTYREGWVGGLPETKCGYGSRLDQTVEQRAWLKTIFAKYEIKSIADIGAGDLNWIKTMDLSGIEYQAFDLVIRDDSVTRFDLIQEVPPKVDCIMCLWVLNHMDFDQCRIALKNLHSAGAKYLIITDRPQWHPEQPPEIQMQALEALLLNEKGDRIKLIRL